MDQEHTHKMADADLMDDELDNESDIDSDEDDDLDEEETEEGMEMGENGMDAMDAELDKNLISSMNAQGGMNALQDEEEDMDLDEIDNILELGEEKYPRFTLAKNKARFLRMVSYYRGKEEWIEVAPLSGVTKLFKQQTKELEGIRSAKLDYEMELETGTLTPSQRSYRRDELKMCKVQEKMAVHLISKLQVKIKSGRR